MLRIASFWRLLVVLAAAMMCGCVAGGTTYDLIDIETDHEVLYSHRYKELVLRDSHGEPRLLARSVGCAIHPGFSPDGEWLAWLDTGTPTLPVSAVDVHVGFAKVPGAGDAVRVELPGIDVDHKLFVDDAVPPIWEPGGRALLVAYAGGIDRIEPVGQRRQLVGGVDVKALALAPHGHDVIFATDRNLFRVPTAGGSPQPLLAADFVPTFGNKQMRALAVLPGEDRLGFALAGSIFVLDLDSGDVVKLFEDRQTVYWLAWLDHPGAPREIVYLAGRERRRSPRYGSVYGEVDGEFRLVATASDGSSSRELFRGHLIDVREVTPALSPDGRYVALTSRPYPNEIYIVATDGSGVRPITADGPNGYPAWRPAR